MIQAIIDIGSNTIRMAVYNINQGNENVEMLMKTKHLVGLAGYLHENVMQQEGIDKVVSVLGEYREFLTKLNIDRIEAFTTAALRNCYNSEQAIKQIVQRSGINVRVMSGDEEAELDFVGATHDLESATGLLVDIGGASTEIVYFKNGHIETKVSMPIGSLLFRKKYVQGLFPTADEIEQMRNETEKSIQDVADFSKIRQAEICGIGGTFKGTTAVYNGMFNRGEGGAATNRYCADTLKIMLNRFSKGKLTEEDTIILLRAISERLETVLPGMVIADALAEHFGSQYINYSDSGVREGFIYKYLLGR